MPDRTINRPARSVLALLDQPGCRRLAYWSLAGGGLLLLSALCQPAAEALAEPGRGALTIGLAAGGGTLDALSIGDLRPRALGRAIGQLEIGWRPGESWVESVSGRIGGSWFDFNGPGVSGNIEDVGWAARWFTDRLLPLTSRRSAYFGLGLEYGEGRSWTHNLAFRDEGPHTFMRGGAVRVGVTQAIARRLQLFGELEEVVYSAHARDASPAADYNWIGRSFNASVGIRWIVLNGRAE